MVKVLALWTLLAVFVIGCGAMRIGAPKVDTVKSPAASEKELISSYWTADGEKAVIVKIDGKLYRGVYLEGGDLVSRQIDEITYNDGDIIMNNPGKCRIVLFGGKLGEFDTLAVDCPTALK